MSVLSCNRRGCENIMCDRYSYEYGYICDECFQELKGEINVDIDDFMCSEKGFNKSITEDWKEKINEEFPEKI